MDFKPPKSRISPQTNQKSPVPARGLDTSVRTVSPLVFIFFLLFLLAGCAGLQLAPERLTHPWPDSHFIQVENLRMHYRDRWPDGVTHSSEIPVIVLVHGLASNSATWDGIIPALKDKYRIIRIDLKGHGFSAKPLDDDYRIETQTRLVRQLLLQIGIRKADIVGHSMGAIAMHLFALRNPDMVQHLVLLSGAVPPAHVPMLPGSGLLARIAHEPRAQMLGQDLLSRWMVDFSYNFVVEDRRNITDNLINNMYLPLALPGGLHGLASATYWVMKFMDDGQRFFRPLRVPTGMIWGTEDMVVPPELANMVQAADPRITLTWVEGAGHNVQEEVPAKVIPPLLEILARPL